MPQVVKFAALFAAGVSTSFAATTVTEQLLPVEGRESVALTVYNHNTALITDRRKAPLEAGANRLAFAGVSGQMRPETVRIGGNHLRVIEQNFEYDLLSPAKLLEKYVGRDIGLVRTHPQTDEELRETGTLLSVANGQPVFRIGNRIETGGSNSPWRYVFDEVPANLRAKPTLTVDLDSRSAGEQTVELAYLSSGLSWKTDYVATMGENDDSMDLVGWVTLNNTSGASYENANLSLVAGDLNVATPPQRQYKAMRVEAMAMADGAAAQQESLFEYYLYKFPRPTTILNNQTKQLQLLAADNVPVSKRYRIDSQQSAWRGTATGQRSQANVLLQFRNGSGSLNQPLPKGVMRFYKGDTHGGMQLLGEDNINHTARNEEIELKLGQAFDITVDRKQLSFAKGYNNREIAWGLEIRNAKSEAVEVEVLERVYGDVTVLEESAKHERVSANILKWTVSVPANGSANLEYRIRQK